MEATKGCTCKQILGKLGENDDDDDEFDDDDGCSREQMERFTGLSAQPDVSAGIGDDDDEDDDNEVTGAVITNLASVSTSETTWLGMISVLSIVALVIVSLGGFGALTRVHGRRKK